MKKIVILCIIIFCLPLFQTCSDENILTSPIYKPGIFSEIIPENQGLHDDFKLSLEQLAEKKKYAIEQFLEERKNVTLNGYEFFASFFQDLDSIPWGFLPFVLSFILIFIAIPISFTKKSKLLFILSLISLVLLLIELSILYFGKMLTDYNQIKIGYYLILIILSLSINESYKDWKRNVR